MGSHEQFKEMVDHLYELYLRKDKDYGDCWRYKNLAEDGLAVRANAVYIDGKVERLRNLAWTQDPKENLPRIFETLRDTAVYAIFGMVLAKELMDDKDKKRFEEMDKHN